MRYYLYHTAVGITARQPNVHTITFRIAYFNSREGYQVYVKSDDVIQVFCINNPRSPSSSRSPSLLFVPHFHSYFVPLFLHQDVRFLLAEIPGPRFNIPSFRQSPHAHVLASSDSISRRRGRCGLRSDFTIGGLSLQGFPYSSRPFLGHEYCSWIHHPSHVFLFASPCTDVELREAHLTMADPVNSRYRTTKVKHSKSYIRSLVDVLYNQVIKSPFQREHNLEKPYLRGPGITDLLDNRISPF
jgi:hypothetical protein